MNNEIEKVKNLIIDCFLFIDKDFINSHLNINLTDTNYYIFMIGVWIVLIFLIWLIIWIFFKIKSLF